MKRPVYVIDAMNYIFRAYHGIQDKMSSPSGMRTNAVLGYLRTLLRIIKERKPDYIAAAFEKPASFRTSIFAEYKANRAPAPADLEPQFEYCRKITKAIGVACLEVDNYEADDVIGTIAAQMSACGHEVIVVTGDKDMSQLVSNGVRVYDMAREHWLDEAAVRDKFGVSPTQIPDLLALHGDHVDNIPGIPGVGEKTARQILSVCRSVEDVAQTHLDAELKFRGRDEILKRIRENMDTVRISRRLATICCDAPVDVTPERLRYRRADRRSLVPLCRELGLVRVIDDIPLAQPTLF
jgi:DNA polymerase-1